MLWGLVCAIAARAGQPIPLEALPEVVRTTLAREWPTAKLVSAEVDHQGIEVQIEKDGVQLGVCFPISSTWSRVERDVVLTELPDAVQRAVKAVGKATSASEVRGPAGTVTYEVIVVKGKKTLLARFDPAGIKLSVEEAPKK